MPYRVAEPIFSGAAGFLLGALGVLTLAGSDLPVPPPAGTVWLALGVGVLGAAAFTALVLVLGRRNWAKRDLVRDAVRSGRLPDVDDRVLHRALWERSVQLRSWRWTWVVAGLAQLLVGGSHLLSPTRDDSVYSRTFWALDIALWIVVSVVWTLRGWRERPKVERLLDELDARMRQRADA